MQVPPDRFAQANPAFALASVRWVCQGYHEESQRAGAPFGLCWLWGLLSLSLLGPEGIRVTLPKRASSKLALLIYEHPDWKFGLAKSMQGWATPFWSAVRLGVSTGTLTLEHGRLIVQGDIENPASSYGGELMSKAKVLGRLLAKEGSDSSVALIFGLAVVL